MGLVSLLGEDETPGPPPPCGQQGKDRERVSSTSRDGVLPRDQICQPPDLGLPASRTVSNKCLLVEPPGLWYFVTAAKLTQVGPLWPLTAFSLCFLSLSPKPEPPTVLSHPHGTQQGPWRQGKPGRCSRNVPEGGPPSTSPHSAEQLPFSHQPLHIIQKHPNPFLRAWPL